MCCCVAALLPPADAIATKADIAFRLLRDAWVVVGKQQAVLLPAVRKVRLCCALHCTPN